MYCKTIRQKGEKMNLSLNSVSSKHRSNPNFGMAVKIDPDANLILKKQLVKMSDKALENYWNRFDAIVNRQNDNPVNILIRKCNKRKALAAEIVDNNDNALDNLVTSQGLLRPRGLKFLEKAEICADRINALNNRLAKYEKAVDADYEPVNLAFDA